MIAALERQKETGKQGEPCADSSWDGHEGRAGPQQWQHSLVFLVNHPMASLATVTKMPTSPPHRFNPSLRPVLPQHPHCLPVPGPPHQGYGGPASHSGWCLQEAQGVTCPSRLLPSAFHPGLPGPGCLLCPPAPYTPLHLRKAPGRQSVWARPRVQQPQAGWGQAGRMLGLHPGSAPVCLGAAAGTRGAPWLFLLHHHLLGSKFCPLPNFICCSPDPLV